MPNILDVAAFMETVAKTFGAEILVDAKTLPWTWRVALGVRVPTPVRPEGPKMPKMFEVAAFSDVVAKTFGACRAFDAKTLPWTWRVALGVRVPTPVRPEGPKMPKMLEVAAFREVVANTTGAEILVDAKTFPWT
jgi:hypothetical protein